MTVYLHHAAVADACRNHPGTWIKARQYATLRTAQTTAYRIRTGSVPAYRPPGAFQAEARPGPLGSGTVYARYRATEETDHA